MERVARPWTEVGAFDRFAFLPLDLALNFAGLAPIEPLTRRERRKRLGTAE